MGSLSIKAIPKLRRVFSHCISNILANPSDVMFWKCLFMLPTILLSKNKFSNINKFSDKILANDFSFKVKDFLNTNVILGEQSKNDFVAKCLRKGNIRKAMNVQSAI